MNEARRAFLKWAATIGSLFSGALVGVPTLRAFLSPVFRPRAAKRWVKAGEVDQIEMGVPSRFDFSETVNDAWVETRALRGVWIYTEDGTEFIVYNGQCTHLGCSYAFDSVAKRFECPCHHGFFDLKSGEVLDGPPPRPLDRLETKIEDGVLYVAYQTFRAGISKQTPVA